jgi:hypothetical protein
MQLAIEMENTTVNTGVYLTLQRRVSLLVALRFRTSFLSIERDPLTITVEGSN